LPAIYARCSKRTSRHFNFDLYIFLSRPYDRFLRSLECLYVGIDWRHFVCGLRIRERGAKVHGILIYVDFSSVERASIELAACVRFHLFCQAFYARPLTARLVGGRKGLAWYAVLMEAVQLLVVCCRHQNIYRLFLMAPA